MKKRLLFIPFIAMVYLMLGVSVSAQQEKKELTLEQRSGLNAHREQLIRSGMPFRMAEERVVTAFENEQQVSLRSRVNPPSSKSIWVNRDPDNLANPHPVYNTATAEDLVKKVLLSDPAAQSRITNVTFTGEPLTSANRSLAYFENGSGIGIQSGLILGTYGVMNAEAPNLGSGKLPGGTSLTGDLHLTSIATATVQGGSILQFDFQPYTSKVTFDFIFASEEYPDYSNASVNDAFGFFVFEQGDPTNFVNIALFPNGLPVTINNSNWGYTSAGNNSPSGLPAPLPGAVNPQWHVPNYHDLYAGSDSIMEYDGRTIKLQAIAENLDPSKTYTLKLAICNISDNAYGSAVFLSNLDLGKAEGDIGGPVTGISVAGVDALGLNEEGEPMFLYGNRPCTYPMKLTFDNVAASTKAIIDINYLTGAGTVFPKSALQDLEGKQLFAVDTIHLNGPQDTVFTYDFKVSTDFDGFVNGQYVGMTVSVRGSSTADTVFYRQLYDTLSWAYQYRMITEVDPGSLTLKVDGGTPYVHRSIDGGESWKPVTQGFTQWELLTISEYCDILLYQPYQCCFDTIKIRRGAVTPEVQRYIDIPAVPGVITTPNPGKYFVTSRKDFTFTATYTGEPMSAQAVGYYTKTTLDLDKTSELQADGSYKYTIRHVVEPWTVSFIPKTNSGDVSNEAVSGQSVWSNGNTLYLHVGKTCIANIYTLTGLLYKQVEVNGNTSFSLPQGFYIVSVDSRQYKVMIK